MEYSNSEMKLDQLIGYFNENKINLIPSFQRGHVWTVPTRQKLLKNIVAKRPIPAIFLYKEAEGSKYSYNILDGKQRLESIIMFIGSRRQDLKVDDVKKYFHGQKERKQINFSIDFEGKKISFENLPENAVRDLREYAIPTIEILLTDSTSLDEIIDLFIDINQQGVKVDRFDIVKAMQNNPLLEDVFDLLAVKEKRKHDIRYKKKDSIYTRVLGKLQTMQNLESPNSVVDRMWERLLELVLYCRTGKHSTPSSILKRFIRVKESDEKAKISQGEKKKLTQGFSFLAKLYKDNPTFAKTKFATDQTHFYTMITSLISSGLLESQNEQAPDVKGLQRKLVTLAKYIDMQVKPPATIENEISEYLTKSQKQTTTTGQREERQKLFLKILKTITPIDADDQKTGKRAVG